MPVIKTLLETAGEPVADTCFPPGEAPPLPYVVFLDTTTRGGGDLRNLMTTHDLTVERYSESGDDNPALEAIFDAQSCKYKKEKQWLSDIECFMTTYSNILLIEREVI
jgi:hypothetical protein